MKILILIVILALSTILTGCPEKPSKPEAGQEEPVMLDADAGGDTD